MKKILLFTTISLLAISSNSYAKTQGSYLGVDAIDSQLEFHQKVRTVNRGSYSLESYSHHTYGVGLNYKYAVNFNGFFIAPGFIIEQNSFGSSSTRGTLDDKLQARNRYGLKADIGFDIGNYVSPYVTGGYSIISYKSRGNGYYSGNNLVVSSRSGYASGAFFGGGFKVNFSKRLSLNLEYNRQYFEAKNDVPPAASSYLLRTKSIATIDILKAGISYNF